MSELKKYLIQKVRDSICSKIDFERITEIRLRVNCPIILHCYSEEIITNCIMTQQDMLDMFNTITGYSAYAYDEQIKNGFLTLPGGHRVGFAGEVVMQNGHVHTIKNISFINMRICHEIIGCGKDIADGLIKNNAWQNVLIISPPGLGKTTLLRDLIKEISIHKEGTSICVIDERNEISGSYMGMPCIKLGLRTDVISNCKKSIGIEMAVRSMSPNIIAVDEIGGTEDLKALKFASLSGVGIMATIHGNSLDDVSKKLGQAYDTLFCKKILIMNKGDYQCY